MTAWEHIPEGGVELCRQELRIVFFPQMGGGGYSGPCVYVGLPDRANWILKIDLFRGPNGYRDYHLHVQDFRRGGEKKYMMSDLCGIDLIDDPLDAVAQCFESPGMLWNLLTLAGEEDLGRDFDAGRMIAVGEKIRGMELPVS